MVPDIKNKPEEPLQKDEEDSTPKKEKLPEEHVASEASEEPWYKQKKYWFYVSATVIFVIILIVAGVVRHRNEDENTTNESNKVEADDFGEEGGTASPNDDLCSESPCGAGQSCVLSTTNELGYVCEDRPMDPCLDSPCLEGLTCVLLGLKGDFECRPDDPCDVPGLCDEGEMCFASRDLAYYQCRVPGACDGDTNPCLGQGGCVNDGDGTFHCEH